MLARLLTAAVLARTAEAGATVVLLLASVQRFGGPATGASVLAALLVPHVVAGPVVGLVTDRARRPRLVHAGFAAVFGLALGGVLLLTGVAPLPVVLALAVVAGTCGPMIFGGLSSRVDDVVPAARRPHARGLDAATYNVAEIAGPAAGALLVAVFGVPVAAVTLSAACLLAAATLLTVAPAATEATASTPGPESAAPIPAFSAPAAAVPVSGPSVPGAPEGAGAGLRGAGPDSVGSGERKPGLRDGLAAMVRSRPLLAVTAATAVASYAAGMITPVAVVLGVAAGRPAGGGLLVTALGVGALCGSLLVARFPLRVPAHRVVLACLVGVGAALAGAAAVVVAGAPWAVLVGVFAVTGVIDGPLLSSVLEVRSREAPPGTRTQVFTLGAGIKLTAASVGAATFTLLAGASPAVLVGVLAAGHVAAAVLGVVLLRTGRAASVRRR
ncbi:MFS transporter [Dactylosporangium sp. NPDC000521]|uniref:MFS transporter n=1 Tax=Dactylosporangium sp. NPDC000521 TaxID=3363975 RepID=UPI00369A1388